MIVYAKYLLFETPQELDENTEFKYGFHHYKGIRIVTEKRVDFPLCLRKISGDGQFCCYYTSKPKYMVECMEKDIHGLVSSIKRTAKKVDQIKKMRFCEDLK